MNAYLEAKEILEEVIGYRRKIHRIAEVGFDLPKTRAFVIEKLQEFGYHDIREIGDGIVTIIGEGEKCLLLRADMDALPMAEETGLSFAAEENCHSCGHDMHTAMLLGVAKLLKRHEKELHGQVKLMFQPAEELLIGSIKMIEAGVLENPRPDAAMMVHVDTTLPRGLYMKSGVASTSSNNYRIEIFGKGAHGAMPHLGKDPTYVGAQILLGIQEILTRELSLKDQAVITTGRFSAGSAPNIIPDRAILEGTMRTYDRNVQELCKARLKELAEGIADLYGCRAEVTYLTDTPSVICDEKFVGEISGYVENLAKDQFSLKPMEAVMASEDFAFIAREIPSAMLMLGVKAPGETYPLHNPKAMFLEDSMPIAMGTFLEVALHWL